ncbi:MAG: hypothetical protein KDC76_13960 [Bacteroidetes bacterium]|nr:hypothetical protein [Bacteroidota bacterium]
MAIMLARKSAIYLWSELLLSCVMVTIVLFTHNRSNQFDWSSINPELVSLCKHYTNKRLYSSSEDEEIASLRHEIIAMATDSDLMALESHPSNNIKALAEYGKLVKHDFEYSLVLRSMEQSKILVEQVTGCLYHQTTWPKFLVESVLYLGENAEPRPDSSFSNHFSAAQVDSLLYTYHQMK